MDRKELFEWLESCPTHKWDITFDHDGHIVVSFPIKEDVNNAN